MQPKTEIPDALLEHLRYPEDLFKVQRYQFARYHVTDPSAWFQGNDRWAVPEDPNVSNNLQPPYRMFVTQPPNLVTSPPPAEGEEPAYEPPTGATWSLTSTFVPNKRDNLAAYVSVDSDATSDTYGQMRVIEVIDDQVQGPGQVNSAIRSDQTVAGELAEFNRSGNQVTYGNLLTVPVGDRLLYVEPVYAQIAGSSSSYPILRFVLVSYQGEVGIGETLNEALAEAGADDIGTGEDPGDPARPGRPRRAQGTVDEQIRELLDDAQTAFEEADQASPTATSASTRTRSTRPRATSRTRSSSPAARSPSTDALGVARRPARRSSSVDLNAPAPHDVTWWGTRRGVEQFGSSLGS